KKEKREVERLSCEGNEASIAKSPVLLNPNKLSLRTMPEGECVCGFVLCVVWCVCMCACVLGMFLVGSLMNCRQLPLGFCLLSHVVWHKMRAFRHHCLSLTLFCCFFHTIYTFRLSLSLSLSLSLYPPL